MNPYRNFSIHRDDRGVVTVSLDVPGRPLNILNMEVMTELDHIVQDLENSDGITLVIFQSGKESGFLAGADVSAIAAIESASEAMRLIEDGQTLLQRIDWLPMPTVAVLVGPCLGGGLELALACDYRVARDNSSTKIGLPEIKLGLIPGWGGTQRLPKVVGVRTALEMILTGKHLSAAEALDAGLVDRAIGPDHWENDLEEFYQQILAGQNVRPRRRLRPLRWLQETALGRSVVLRMTERSIASKAKQYPALEAAVRAVRLGCDGGIDGFMTERTEFVDLLATPTARQLLGLFFARERARNVSTWTHQAGQAVHPDPIRRIGVIGGGAMGAGIGQLAAVRGYDVVIKEVSADLAEQSRRRVDKLVSDLARRKGWSPRQRSELMNKIAFVHEDQPLIDCDLVVEAIVERQDVKDKVFQSLDRIVKPSAILASNTSSLSITRMANVTKRASQVAGLHFFNPVHRMELVEVVRAAKTDEATIARLVALVKALGKTPVVTSDSPGFLVNRVLFPYLGEAVLMVSEGAEIAAIDKQVRQFGMPMGPLELLDQVGLDVALHVAGSLNQILSGVQPVVDQLSAMVDRGHLGKKSGRGFYHYRRGKRKRAAEVPVTGSTSGDKTPTMQLVNDGLTAMQRRLIYPMLAEAVRCHEEHIVTEAWAIDLAMVLGTGFAPHRGGPLHVIDAIGLQQVHDNLKQMAQQYGERFTPPDELVAMSNHGETFFGSGGTTQQQFVSSV